MKYYAVTDDPNELYHYGRKGMKWGKHIFGDKPKSPAFKSAMTKLRTLSKKASSTIKTSRAQHAVNKERRQQDRYNKAVQAAQKRIQITENLHNLNNLQSYEKRVAQDYKQQRKADHAAEKRYNKFAKNERKMDKFTQLAREGRLKYGQLSDEQVSKITDRLALEKSARSLGNTEKPKFKIQVKQALQKGIIDGIAGGTAAAMTEVAKAKVQNRFANKRVLDKKSEYEAERQREANRIRNKKTYKEIREDIKDEAYEAQVKAGVGALRRNQFVTTKGAAKALQDAQNRMDSQKKLASDWQDFLNEKHLTDKQARKQFDIKGRNVDEKMRNLLQTSKDMNEQQQKIEEAAAYKKFSDQQVQEVQNRINIEKQEKENARLKSEYESDMEQYRKDEEYNKKLKDKYDQDMDKYNKDMETYNHELKVYKAKLGTGYINVQKPIPPEKPKTPNYRKTTKPDKPNYHIIDYNSTQMPLRLTYDEYKRLSGMGINIYGNGGGKNKNKNKGGRN